MGLVAAYNVGDRFFHLGLVSFPELISLKVEVPDPLNPAKQQPWEIIIRPNQTLNILTPEDKEKLKQQFLN